MGSLKVCVLNCPNKSHFFIFNHSSTSLNDTFKNLGRSRRRNMSTYFVVATGPMPYYCSRLSLLNASLILSCTLGCVVLLLACNHSKDRNLLPSLCISHISDIVFVQTRNGQLLVVLPLYALYRFLYKPSL